MKTDLHQNIFPLPEKFWYGPVEHIAARLLGCLLVSTIGDETVQVRIVETEAYDQSDVASHSYRGLTPRTSVMFGPPRHLYVYFTYGMHYCCNIVVGPEGHGAAVLMRAVEPLAQSAQMSARRGGKMGPELTNGPAKLCQALGIDTSYNGHDLDEPPLKLIVQPSLAPGSIIQTTRIGISRGQEVPWRFFVKDNPYVSHAN